MNEQEFDAKFADFIEEFDESFDTDEHFTQIRKFAIAHSDSEDEIAISYEHLYQKQRTNNMIKLALKTFLLSDEDN